MKFGAKWPLSACMSDVMKLPADNAILHKISLQLIFKTSPSTKAAYLANFIILKIRQTKETD